MASVVQLTHMLMTHGGIMKAKVVDELTLLASIMAATVHDYGHGGVNNDFLNRYSRPSSTLCCIASALCCASHLWCCADAAVLDLYTVRKCIAVAVIRSLQTSCPKLHVHVRQGTPAWCSQAAHVAAECSC